MNNEQNVKSLKEKILNPDHWVRLILMLLMYIVLLIIVKLVVLITLVIQWLMVLLSGAPHEGLKRMTKSMNHYTYQIMEYISFNSDTKPFPLSDLPE